MTRKSIFRTAAFPAWAVLLICGAVLSTGSLCAQDLSGKLNEALDKEVFPLQNEAISLKNEKQYDKAVKKCDQALKKLDSMKEAQSSPIAKDTRVMLQGLKNDINSSWSDHLLAEANRELDRAQEISGSGQSDLLASHCEKAKSLAAQAMKISSSESVKTRGNAMIQIANDRIQIDKSANSQTDRALLEERKQQLALVKKNVLPLLEQAQKLNASAKYKEADLCCGKALDSLEKLSVSDKCKMEYRVKILQCRSEVRRNLLKFYVDSARQNYLSAVEQSRENSTRSSGLANTAIQLVLEARRTVPGEGTEELKAIEDACTALIKSNTFRNETSLASIDPDGKSKKEDIRVLLREGEVFYRNRLYGKARDSFEQAIILDPYNERAISMLSRIYQKISKVATLRRDNEMLERLNELEWKWNQSPLPKEIEETEDAGPAEYTQASAARIEEKLNTIIIPSFEVTEQPVSEILKELGNLCKSNDSSSVGIKFMYSPMPNQDEPQLTLSLVSVPVSVILKYLCEFTGLQYRVGDNSIIVGYIDNMERRSFKMSPSRYETICKDIASFYSGGGGGEVGGETKAAGGGGDAGGKEDNPFESSNSDGKFPEDKAVQQEVAKVSNEQLKQYFTDMGIKFPPQSSVGYNAASNMLNVTNTPENLNDLATLLKETDIPVPLILIEAKIVEITVKDLEELGFDWTLSHINQNPQYMFASGSASSYLPNSAGLFDIGSKTSVTQQLLRHTDGVIGAGGSMTLDSTKGNMLVQGLQVLPNFGPGGQWSLSLDIRAIDRSERAELLQAPKVIAFNGNKATIMYAETRYFPESWNEPEVTSSSGNNYLYTPSYPEFDEGKEYGTKFEVTPRVGANNATINLLLHPIIQSQTGWTSYDYEIKVGSFSTGSYTDSSGNTYKPTIKMAEVSKRELLTSLKVYDGETVVLGGILEEISKRGEDKFPFLGEVPLLGRFFQDRSKNAAKTNLLIFVTARIMGLDGVPRTTNSDNGLFEFYR